MPGFTSENTFPKPGMRLIENSKPYLLRCQHTLSATPDNTSVPREGCGKELLRGLGSELMSPRTCSRCWREWQTRQTSSCPWGTLGEDSLNMLKNKIKKIILVTCKYHEEDEVGCEREGPEVLLQPEWEEASLKRSRLSEDQGQGGGRAKIQGTHISRMARLVLGTKTRTEGQKEGNESGGSWGRGNR